jgi:mannose-6-phosphate isomerase-like protein (cupin superfamily)
MRDSLQPGDGLSRISPPRCRAGGSSRLRPTVARMSEAKCWVVVRGTAEVTLGEERRAVHENESIYIPIGSVHRMANQRKIPLELIEVQTGSYFGEDDIERLEDVYKRT